MASTHVSLISAGGTNNRRIASSIYGYCTTTADTAAKTVSLYTGNGTTADGTWTAADLFHGLHITVRFQYANGVASPTLNVNGTGAKPIYRYGTTAPSTSAASSWQANAVVDFTYDTLLNSSGCWVMHSTWDNNTTYRTMTQAQATAGTSTSAMVITPKVLHDTIEAAMPAPLSSYHVTLGNGVESEFQVSHYLNTEFILVSAVVEDNDNGQTYIAPNSSIASDSRISYVVQLIDENSFYITFSSPPMTNSIKLSVISAIAYSSASDENFLKI